MTEAEKGSIGKTCQQFENGPLRPQSEIHKTNLRLRCYETENHANVRHVCFLVRFDKILPTSLVLLSPFEFFKVNKTSRVC